MRDVLILGGYGTFGKRIAWGLARQNIPVVIAGRSAIRAGALMAQIRGEFPFAILNTAIFDADKDLEKCLKRLEPAVVVNTCGPFQGKDYRIAETCIRNKAHYIDIADARDFVTGIRKLDRSAKQAGVSVIGGASTVPGLSSAVLDHYKSEFGKIDALRFGIAPGQKTECGLATVQAIMGYVGRPLKPLHGNKRFRYGWQNLYRQIYPELGVRWMANCEVPDLDLLPPRYGIRRIQFSAGMESAALHFGIWLTGWAIRLGLPLNLAKHAEFLLRASHWFDRLGSDAGGMHVVMTGNNPAGDRHERKWFLIARNGDGPQVPCVPAILLAKTIIKGGALPVGAYPCLGFISLNDYLAELERFAIDTHEL